VKGEKYEAISVGNVAVKLYRRRRPTANGKKRRTIYEIADYTSGIRRLQSFTDHGEAWAKADSIAKQLATGDALAASMTNAQAASYGNAVEILRPTGISLELAAAHYTEAFTILGGDRIIEAAKEFIRRNPTERPARTVAEVAAELIELKTNRKAGPRYLEDLRNRLDTFAKAFAVNVDSLTTTDMQAWLDGMKSAPRTVKNFRDTVNSLFKFAEARGYIVRGENPVTATQKIATRNSEPITIYTPAELQRLIAAAPAWFKPVIALQAFAGLRSAEVLRLDWRDVKLARGLIALGADKTKTATRRLVPILPNLAQWLAPHALKSGRVFGKSRAYFHEVQREVAADTRIESDLKKSIAAQKPVEWKHNALRHSFISYRVAELQDVAKVALEAGNSPAMIFSNYRELVDASAAKAWFAVAPKTAANVIHFQAAQEAAK